MSKDRVEDAKRLKKRYEKRLNPHSEEYEGMDENFLATNRVIQEMKKYYPKDYELIMKIVKEHQDKIFKKRKRKSGLRI